MKIVEVIIWDRLVGILVWDEKENTTSFEFSKEFIKSEIQLSPLITLLSSKITKIKAEVDNNSITNFGVDKGLPLFISDSLPDKFGSDLFSKYLEKEGRNFRDLNPLEKLTYIGSRGMGALEYRPAQFDKKDHQILDLKKLNELSISLLNNEPISHIKNMLNLFHVGTSPGGAQPKVLINIDRVSGNVFRGDSLPNVDQDSWILKFNKDIGLESDKDRGKVEYAYFLMAKKAGINFMDSELKEIEGESYFMTKRFDRIGGKKIHTQTLHALAGMNFQLPNTYSYEQIFTVLNQLKLDYSTKDQLFRTMVFNVLSRNVDDHTKNFGFQMDENGDWSMSPAYDITFTYNENFKRITPHFLSINGKNQDHELEDFLVIAKEYSIKNPKKIIAQINESLCEWDVIASELKVSSKTIDYISSKLIVDSMNL